MKGYASLKTARRSLIIQVTVLFLIVAAIILIGRITTQNVFDMDLIVAHDPEDAEDSDFTVKWEKTGESPEGGIPIHSMELREVSDDRVSAKSLHISMTPDEPGDYKMTVLNKEGYVLGTDSIHVDRFRTVFSWSTGSFTGNEAVMVASVIFYLGLLIISLVHFFNLKGPQSCSYDAILSAGIFLFCAVALVVNVPVYLRHLRMPAFYPTWQILSDIAGGGRYFVLLTYPLIVIFSLLLIISNIELLRHERPRIQNVLGLTLGLLMIGAGLGYILIYRHFLNGSNLEYKVMSTVINVLGIVITYAECVLLSSVICSFRVIRRTPARDMDYILILGCGFRKDGTLPPLLRGRVDKAIEFWRRQKQETGKEAVIIPSGGQGPNECMAESEAMYRYLVSTRFPENAIVQENQSANTYQNMEFSRRIIETREGRRMAVADTNRPGDSEISDSTSEGCVDHSTAGTGARGNGSGNAVGNNVKTAYVTTNYHVFRSGVWAELAGLRAEGIGSRTKWWFWPNAFVRECVGLLRNRIVPETVLLVILTVVFGLISYFAL